MVMDLNTLPRRLSSGSVNGISVDISKKKKVLLHMFQSKKSSDAAKSPGSLMSYFKHRKHSPSSKKSEMKTPPESGSTANIYNTWTMRASSTSEPSLIDEPHTLKSRFLRNRSSLSKSKSSPSPTDSDATPPVFVDLFTHNPADERSKLSSKHRASAASDNDLLDCVERSRVEMLRPVSASSSTSTLTSSIPPTGWSSTSTISQTTSVGEPEHAPTCSSQPPPFKKRQDTLKNIFSRVTSLHSDKNNLEGQQFDTWRGRNAMTLPRQIAKDTFSTGDASKSSDKTKRPTILTERPRSMMINRQAPYTMGPTPGSYPASGSNSQLRPTSTLGYQGNITEQAGITRPHYGDEEDGITSRLSAKLQISDSCESLDEVATDSVEFESDPDLTRPDEPDSWSSTVDKKSMKKMSLSKKDVKRQENIYEFILTERNHLTTLKIMQKVYARGLVRELNTDQSTIEKLFPLIDEHVEVVSQLVQQLLDRQNAGKVVSGIGDIMVGHWEGSNGETVKRLFGDFCSKQNEITNFYKDLMKNDKKFFAFMKKYEKKTYTRRQDVLACALLITQRLTKYPIMLQTMLENSNKKDHKEDYQKLERALMLSREIAKDVDDQVQTHEREILLMETYDKIETKSSTTFKDRRFDRKDFLKTSRKLLFSTNLQWYKEGKKFVDIFLLLLTDCIVMLQENGGKYTFLSGQPAAVPLQKMIVREVANDEKALYLMSMRTQQMYTLKLGTSDECKTLTNKIRLAIGKCPDEDEGITSEEEGERRSHDQRMDKAKQAVKQLELTDQRIIRTLEEKMSFFKTLAETVGRGSAVSDLHFSFVDYSTEENKLPPGQPILLKALEQVNRLTNAFYGPSSPFKHTLSVGESSARAPSALPKRSDTFGGFDNGKEPSHPRVKYLNSSQSDSKLSDLEQSKEDLSSCNRDSGFHSELAMSHGSHSSIPKAWESSPLSEDHVVSDPPESTYLPPTSDQVQALTFLAQTLSEYQSFAAQQDTLVEKLQLQLSGKKRSLGGGLQEAELKRNQIKQQEQMDDLRKQQQQLRNERDHWQKQVERFQRSFDSEKAEFEREKLQIRKEREENEKQRTEIQKTKDHYHSEVKRLKELQRSAQHEMHTSSSTSSLPSNKNNSSNVEAISRSYASLQAHSVDISDGKHSPTYAEGDYPRTYPSHKREHSNSNPQQLPIHMQYSIVNQQQAAAQQRMKQQQQQDMSKLSKLAKSTSSKPSSSDKGGFHQLLPGKLKLSAQTQSSKKHHIV